MTRHMSSPVSNPEVSGAFILERLHNVTVFSSLQLSDPYIPQTISVSASACKKYCLFLCCWLITYFHKLLLSVVGLPVLQNFAVYFSTS